MHPGRAAAKRQLAIEAAVTIVSEHATSERVTWLHNLVSSPNGLSTKDPLQMACLESELIAALAEMVAALTERVDELEAKPRPAKKVA